MRLLVAFCLLAALAIWAWSLPSGRPRAERGEVVVPAEAEGPSVPEQPPAQAEPPVEQKTPGTPVPRPPEDPIEQGKCSLRLALTDRDTGKDVKGTVRLYRLDAPGNEHWTRGDQVQAVIDIAPGGTVIGELPEGLYRIFCLDQPAGSEDPDAFLVSGALTRITLAIPLPRTFEASLVVVDENGRRFENGKLRGGGRYFSDRQAEPQWRAARTLREPERYFGGIGFGAGASGGRSLRSAIAENGRFLLGRYREDSRRRKSTVRWRWQVPDRTEVRVKIEKSGARPREYGGISIPIEPIRRSVLLPDGGLAAERGAKIEAWHDAREGEPPALSDAVISVRATLDGHEPLEFGIRADAAPPVKTMKRKAAK